MDFQILFEGEEIRVCHGQQETVYRKVSGSSSGGSDTDEKPFIPVMPPMPPMPPKEEEEEVIPLCLSDITRDKLLRAYSRKGFPLSEGDYEMNIFGVRSKGKARGVFADAVGLLYFKEGKGSLEVYPAITDAGAFLTDEGVPAPGFYRDCFKLGRSLGSYAALVGVSSFPKSPAGVCHASSNGVSYFVEKGNEGCQVIEDISDWNRFFSLVLKSSKLYGEVFSYALFEQDDLI